ncbi:uncharacterized protein LOC144791642 isoform X1 [Lissotriton helveticus]
MSAPRSPAWREPSSAPRSPDGAEPSSAPRSPAWRELSSAPRSPARISFLVESTKPLHSTGATQVESMKPLHSTGATNQVESTKPLHSTGATTQISLRLMWPSGNKWLLPKSFRLRNSEWLSHRGAWYVQRVMSRSA